MEIININRHCSTPINPLLFFAFENLETYRKRVCIVCIHLNITISTTEYLLNDGKTISVADKCAINTLKKIGNSIIIRPLIFSVLSMAVLLALPPYQ